MGNAKTMVPSRPWGHRGDMGLELDLSKPALASSSGDCHFTERASGSQSSHDMPSKDVEKRIVFWRGKGVFKPLRYDK
jgi:hypothetical protein